MTRLDHLAIPVRDHARSREWYTKHLGAELRDPDGYLIYLWDERSMREQGGG